MIVRLLNDSEKHNKVWSAELTNNGVITVETKWGRLGTKGQSKTETFYSEYEAKHAIEKKRNEKERKGYFEIDEAEYRLKHLEAEIVGSECKIIDLHFVELTGETEGKTQYRVVHPTNLSDPSCTPQVLCTLQLRTGIQSLLVDINGIHNINVTGKERKHVGTLPTEVSFWVENSQKLDEDSDDPIIQKLVKKAPAIIETIINRPPTANDEVAAGWTVTTSYYQSIKIVNLDD